MDQILAATPTITIIDAVKVIKQQLEVHLRILQNNLIPLQIHPEVQHIILQYHHLQIIVTFLYGHGHALVVVVILT